MPSRKNDTKEKNNRKKPPLYNYSKYTGIGFQIAAAVAVGVILGNWLDNQFPNQYHLFTLLLSLLAIGGSLYLIIKEFNNGNK